MLAWSSGSIGVGQDKSTEPPPKPEEVVIPEGLDSVARLQHVAITALTADWGYWGYRGEGERIEGEIGSFYMFLLTILGMMEISGSALWIFYLLGSDIFEVSHGDE